MINWKALSALMCCLLLAALAAPGCGEDEKQVDATCADGLMNGDETDVDCGGPDCPPCAEGKSCIVGDDCLSGLCEDGVCAPATIPVSCDNGIMDGDETSVDCGGPDCPPCADGEGCLEDGDCVSGNCEEGVCAPAQAPASCDNGVRDGNETGVDCGGPDCPPCADGEGCLEDGDCVSGNCEDGDCAPAPIPVSCDNGIMDGDETGIDCGGPDCPACPTGMGCVEDTDCEWHNCRDGMCGGLQSCMDGMQNGHETDVDCGGPFCHGCGAGMGCLVDSDCLSQECANGFCTEPSTETCENDVRDGLESDVDCGGGLCPGCPNGYACNVHMDCEFGYCDEGMCGGTWMCANGMQDGKETDVDCGGGLCPPCLGGQGCLVDDDCLSEVCEDGVCAERALTCDNGVQDGRETDVDCGGACDPCQEGQSCVRHADCETLACIDGTCGRSIVTIQAGTDSVDCVASGTVVIEHGVSFSDLAVVSGVLDLGDQVGFWVQQPDALLQPEDGRWAGIYVVADKSLADGVERYTEIALMADYVENDCHSELHVLAPTGSITVTPDYMAFGYSTAVTTEILLDGGSREVTEPFEGVYVDMAPAEIIDVDGYDGPEEPGSPKWTFKLEGGVLAAADFGFLPGSEPQVGQNLRVHGYVTKRQGVYLLVADSVSQDTFW